MTGHESRIRLVGSSRSQETLDDLEEDDLMLLARSGRQDAFEALVGRYQGLVFSVATRFFGDRATGRDVAQDVFLALWAERDRYKPRGRFRSFLVSMTLHRCHTVARKRKTRRQHQQLRSSATEDSAIRAGEQELPIQQVIEHERALELRRLLAQVSEKQRCVLVLRFTLDLTFEEIAEATGLPIGTVKSHVFRGLRQLRRLVKE